MPDLPDLPDVTIIDRTEYLPGVPCFIDTEQPDPEAAAEFYGGVFGWEFENKLPPGIDDKYLVASLHGLTVAAIASPTSGVPQATWNTYVSVADVDATAAQAVGLGAELLVGPVDAGPPGAVAGRWAHIVGPDGAHLRLWQPGYRHGAQLVNAPGSWNSSNLMTDDADRAKAFFGAVFGWEAEPVEFGGGDAEGESFQWRLPGYGDFLAIRDPDIKRRHDEPWVPEGFSDVIGWMTAGAAGGSGYWNVTFGVDGTDAVVERAVKLGATVVSPPTDRGGGIVRVATVRDPQGAEFTVGSFDPSKLEAG
jgi:predicted enzyme related to lactoylglutathione lyase